jgi:integrase
VLQAKKIAAARTVETIGDLLPDYLAFKEPNLKPLSFSEVKRQLKKHAKPIHDMPIKALDHERIADLLAELAETRPVLANHVRAALSDFGRWLQQRKGTKTVPINVFAFTLKANTNGARTRTPSTVDLALIWRAAGDDDYAAVVRLLMLTGARRSVIAELRWSEIDLDAALITVAPERAGLKTRQKKINSGKASAFEIPLSAPALAILQARPRMAGREPVFGAGSRGISNYGGHKLALDLRIAALAAETGVPVPEPWSVHDFRRSMSKTMNEGKKDGGLGIAPHVVEACLGHATFKQGVAGTYNTATYDNDKRTAFNLWAEHLMAAVEGRDAKVVPFNRAAS